MLRTGIFRQRATDTAGSTLGQTIGQLVKGVAVMTLHMLKADTRSPPSNKQQRGTQAGKITMTTNTPKGLRGHDREQEIRDHAHTVGWAG